MITDVKIGQFVSLDTKSKIAGTMWFTYLPKPDDYNPHNMQGVIYKLYGNYWEDLPITVRWENGKFNSYGPEHLNDWEYKTKTDFRGKGNQIVKHTTDEEIEEPKLVLFFVYHIKGVKVGYTSDMKTEMDNFDNPEYEILDRTTDKDTAIHAVTFFNKQFNYVI